MTEANCTESSCKKSKEITQSMLKILGKPHTLSLLSFFVHEAPRGARFNEIKKHLDLPPNTLSRRLKELEIAGLVIRKAINEVPPRVDYKPSVAAKSLGSVLKPLHHWLDEHAEQLLGSGE